MFKPFHRRQYGDRGGDGPIAVDQRGAQQAKGDDDGTRFKFDTEQ